MSTVLENAKNNLANGIIKSRIPFWVWIVIAVLVIIRLLLPIAGLYGINWALANKMGNYDGHVEDFELSLYRGAYQLQGLTIKKIAGKEPPILEIDEIDLSLAWRRLLQKELSGDVTLRKAQVRLIDSKDDDKKQLGNDEPGWKEALKVIIPITVESLTVSDSSIEFTNHDLSKKKPVQIEKIEFTATDLRTRARNSAEALSPFQFRGIIQQHALLKASGKIDILAKLPRADINFSMVKFHPRTVNELLMTYLPLDLSKGEISIYGEAATSRGDVKGYANVFLKDVTVIAQDQNFVSVKHFFYEILGAFGNWLLKNNKDNTVAAHIPFSRTKGKFDIGASEAFWSAVQNKSNELKPGFENSITLKNLEGNEIPKEKD